MKVYCQNALRGSERASASLHPSAGMLPLARPSLAGRIAAFGVRLYQLFLSPLKAILFGTACGCRFQPTCSCYAREALLRYGFFKGAYYAIRRILRCHPWHPGGYDPVPCLKSDLQAARQATIKTLSDG